MKEDIFMFGTIWSLVPPIIAIVLALITKEVYSSLFVGILAAALFASDFQVVTAYNTIINDGFIGSLSDAGHVGIIIFLVVLGTIVILMNRAGGSSAYGKWAQRKLKSRKGALLSTFALGCMIFVDDYFNCLTVGSVMRPVTDKHGISRAKLAYIIDATAAPICMIAPISSWAAAVAGVVEGYDGLTLFIKAIPYNLYSLMTIAAIILISCLDVDFGLMKVHEDNAKKGDLFTDGVVKADASEERPLTDKAKVIDLLFPVFVLIIGCIIGMIYTGGFFDGENFIDAFANCDATVGLPLGSVAALIITIIYYMGRRLLSFKECMQSFPEGFKSMVAPILILSFAWTLSGLTKALGAPEYVSAIFEGSAARFIGILPAIVFVFAIFMSFSTGTSWGTFGILIPIIVGIGLPEELMIITISSCLAGSVCGDHCSPISDTTIMASAGAQCDHINHVATQLPYTSLVAAVSFVGYLFAGFIQNPWIVLAISFVILLAVIAVIKKRVAKA